MVIEGATDIGVMAGVATGVIAVVVAVVERWFNCSW